MTSMPDDPDLNDDRHSSSLFDDTLSARFEYQDMDAYPIKGVNAKASSINRVIVIVVDHHVVDQRKEIVEQ